MISKKLFFGLSILFFSAACKGRGDIQKIVDPITFSAEIQNVQVGERVSVFYEGGVVQAIVVSCGEETVFELEGTVPEGKNRYVAVYPNTQEASYGNGNLELYFQDEIFSGGKSDVIVQIAAVSSMQDTFVFSNACPYVKYTLETDSVYEARLYADDVITGRCLYKFEGNSAAATRITQNGGREMRILLSPEASDSLPFVERGCSGKEVYIPVIPGSDASMFTLRMKDIRGWSFPSLQFAAGSIFEPGTVLDLGEAEKKMKQSSGEGSLSLRVMSFNIMRGDTNAEHLWPTRKDGCIEMFNTDNPDIFGLQECNSTQRYDVLANLPQYAAVGVSWKGDRTGAYNSTSSNTIFYCSEKLELLKWGTYWNSPEPDRWPTPARPNPCWYYSKSINTNWAIFEIKGTEKRVVFICSHMVSSGSGLLSQYSSEASLYSGKSREEALALLVRKVKSEINPQGYPMIYVADFNCAGTESYCAPIRSIMQMTKEIAKVTDKGRTYNAFVPNSTRSIDHIFCNGFNVSTFCVDRNPYAGVVYISDHYPVYSDMEIK